MKGLAGRVGPLLIGIGAVYLTVWLHELGHSAAAYGLGCKANWWKTGTSPLLWSSWGGDIDYRCVEHRGPLAVVITSGAGVAVNLLLLLTTLSVLGMSREGRNPWLLVGGVFLALSNYAEAFSYLMLNTVWLKSDMASLVGSSGTSRWIWFAGGTAAAGVAGWGLWRPMREAAAAMQSPWLGSRSWLILFVTYAAVIGVTMAFTRIVLT